MLFGLLKRRCLAAEARSGLAYLQHGNVESAQEAFTEAMEKFSKIADTGVLCFEPDSCHQVLFNGLGVLSSALVDAMASQMSTFWSDMHPLLQQHLLDFPESLMWKPAGIQRQLKHGELLLSKMKLPTREHSKSVCDAAGMRCRGSGEAGQKRACHVADAVRPLLRGDEPVGGDAGVRPADGQLRRRLCRPGKNAGLEVPQGGLPASRPGNNALLYFISAESKWMP